jgi:hypothetical protein
MIKEGGVLLSSECGPRSPDRHARTIAMEAAGVQRDERHPLAFPRRQRRSTRSLATARSSRLSSSWSIVARRSSRRAVRMATSSSSVASRAAVSAPPLVAPPGVATVAGGAATGSRWGEAGVHRPLRLCRRRRCLPPLAGRRCALPRVGRLAGRRQALPRVGRPAVGHDETRAPIDRSLTTYPAGIKPLWAGWEFRLFSPLSRVASGRLQTRKAQNPFKNGRSARSVVNLREHRSSEARRRIQ